MALQIWTNGAAIVQYKMKFGGKNETYFQGKFTPHLMITVKVIISNDLRIEVENSLQGGKVKKNVNKNLSFLFHCYLQNKHVLPI